MANAVTLQVAVDTAWSIFRATRFGVEDSDSRRCLLERHLHERWKARGGDDADELASFGLAYLTGIVDHEC